MNRQTLRLHVLRLTWQALEKYKNATNDAPALSWEDERRVEAAFDEVVQRAWERYQEALDRPPRRYPTR